jgi:hypothetical protein
MRISLGFVITGGSMRRVIASRTIERQRAIRKTALKKAPRISARSHYRMVSKRSWTTVEGIPTPKEYLSVEGF